jgi:hypothetical protein
LKKKFDTSWKGAEEEEEEDGEGIGQVESDEEVVAEGPVGEQELDTPLDKRIVTREDIREFLAVAPRLDPALAELSTRVIEHRYHRRQLAVR